jgi:hypothetical protein
MEGVMAETFGAVVGELRDLVADQVALWRRLLEATRGATRALGAHDADDFERALALQVETLRALKGLERERGRLVRSVGEGTEDDATRALRAELAQLAAEVQRAGRVAKLSIERNGALVEARIGLHRQAGTLDVTSRSGVDRLA